MYHSFLIHSSADGHLGCVHVLAIIHSAAMNNGMGWLVGLVAKSCPTFVTPWTVACQASLSMGFPRLENWYGLPHPPPGGLLNTGVQPVSPALAG